MRVRCVSEKLTDVQRMEISGSISKPPIDFGDEISVGKEYVVLSVNFSINSTYINGVQIEICSDLGKVSCVPICLFEIVDDRMSRFCKVRILREYFILQPSEFFPDYFLDMLTDGDPECVKIFRYVVAYMEGEFLRDDDLIRMLLQRAESLKKNTKVELSDEEMNIIEFKLGIKLPGDFKVLSKFYRYDFFRMYNFFTFYDEYNFEKGVVEETLYYREYSNLSSNYVVLNCDDSFFIVLNAKDDGKSEVIRCSHADFLNLCDNLPMQYNPTIFPTFADFYSFLLDDEEKMREEEKASINQN